MSEYNDAVDAALEECHALCDRSETLVGSSEALEMLDRIQENIEDAQQELQSAKMELTTATKQTRQYYSGRIETFTTRIKLLKKRYEEKRNLQKRQQLGLLSYSDNGEVTGLLKSSQYATQALHGARSTLSRTEDQGADILSDLREQRRTLERAKANLREGSGISSHLKSIYAEWKRGTTYRK